MPTKELFVLGFGSPDKIAFRHKADVHIAMARGNLATYPNEHFELIILGIFIKSTYLCPMRLFFAKLSVATALSFLLAHNLSQHHHHDHIEISQHHHDDNHDDCNSFSFVQLDNNFLISQSHFSLSKVLVSLFFVLPDNNLTSEISLSSGNGNFGLIEEFQPPDKYFPYSSLRGPPAV